MGQQSKISLRWCPLTTLHTQMGRLASSFIVPIARSQSSSCAATSTHPAPSQQSTSVPHPAASAMQSLPTVTPDPRLRLFRTKVYLVKFFYQLSQEICNDLLLSGRLLLVGCHQRLELGRMPAVLAQRGQLDQHRQRHHPRGHPPVPAPAALAARLLQACTCGLGLCMGQEFALMCRMKLL